MTQPRVFLREATGLVRQFTWYDAMALSMAVSGPVTFGIVGNVGYVIPNNPGANLPIAMMIGFLFWIPVGLLYYLLTVQMPRSGGDYVWLGRGLHPILGFVGGWVMFISFVALLSSASVTQPAVVVPDIAVAMGYSLHNPGLISWGQSLASSTTNIFLGTLLTIICGFVIASLPAKFYSHVMLAITAVILASTVVFMAVFATASSESFISGLSSMTNGSVTVDGTIAQAAEAGLTYVPLNLTSTFAAVPFGVLLFNGFTYSAYFAGEVKNVRWSMMWGMFSALIACGLVDIIGIYYLMGVMGYPFVQATFALFGAGKFSLGVPPWAPVFLPAVSSSPYLVAFMELGFFLYNPWWAAGLCICLSRYIFAFSFDRVLPTFFADVNDRLHIPLKGIGLAFVFAVIFAYIAVYTSYIGQLLNTVVIWTIVWVLLGITAIVITFWRKELARNVLGGRWLLPICGFLTVVGMATTFYWANTIPAIGPSNLGSAMLLIVIFASGAVIYLVRYFYFKGKGIDLIDIQREIPPE